MTTPEGGETLGQITFGDIVISRTHNSGEPSLVVETREDGTRVEAMLFVPEEGRYGMPATIPVNEIDKIVGHRTYGEAVDAMARAITGGSDPDQALLQRVRELTAGYGAQQQ